MKIECPHCSKDFAVSATAVIPKKQVLFINMKCESEMFCAKTIGKAILNMETLQREVAKEIGWKIAVFIESIELKAHEITIGFHIVETGSCK